MMRALISVAVMLAGVVFLLAAAGGVFLMTLSIEAMGHGLIRWLAIAAALCLGSGLLVGSVFVAVKLAVLFGSRAGQEPPKTARVDLRDLQQQDFGGK